MRARSPYWSARTPGWRAVAVRRHRICLLPADQRAVIAVVRRITNVHSGPNWASIALARRRRSGQVRHSSTLFPPAQVWGGDRVRREVVHEGPYQAIAATAFPTQG